MLVVTQHVGGGSPTLPTKPKRKLPVWGWLLVGLAILAGLLAITRGTRPQQPPGKDIVFVRGNGIYIMNADGSNQARLSYNIAGEHSPTWSPDGARIAFISNRDGKGEIYVMDADGSNQTRLTHNDVYDGSPVWSPDGAQIAFTSSQGGCICQEIYVMNADGSGQTRLTHNKVGDSYPTWSPDSTQIAFMSERNKNRDIYIISIDGSGLTRLTYNIADDRSPAWRP